MLGDIDNDEAYWAVGVRKVFLWPVADNTKQLEKFHQGVLPELSQ